MKPTKEQELIYYFIRHDSSHGIINAVAGSGKTTTIIESIEYVEEGKSMMFCAFNKSIRDEIQSRVQEKTNRNIIVKNLHQLGYDILKSNSSQFYKVKPKKYYALIDQSLETSNKISFLKYLKLHKVNPKPTNSFDQTQFNFFRTNFKSQLLECVDKFRLNLGKNDLNHFKNLLIHFNIIDTHKSNKSFLNSLVSILFESTKELLKDGNTLAKFKNEIDLTDMLYLPKVFEIYPLKTYDILFVDECQDLSKAQLAIALKFVKKTGRVIAVGDPCQSIYGFTGADIESFSRIEKVLKPHKKLNLSYCFRCPNKVIAYAQQFRTDIKPFRDKPGEVHHINFNEVIKTATSGDLIISRLKAPLTLIFFGLIEDNRKVNIHKDDIKDVLNELRFLFTKQELNSTNRFKNASGFFDKVEERNIYFIEKKATKFSDAISKEEFIQQETEYIKRRIDFIKKQTSIHSEVPTINGLIQRIENLISNESGAVKLSTIHKCKGLENDRVFILDYDKLPYVKENHKAWEVIQENNLKYVALTRVKTTLFMVHSSQVHVNEPEGNLFDNSEDIW